MLFIASAVECILLEERNKSLIHTAIFWSRYDSGSRSNESFKISGSVIENASIWTACWSIVESNALTFMILLTSSLTVVCIVQLLSFANIDLVRCQKICFGSASLSWRSDDSFRDVETEPTATLGTIRKELKGLIKKKFSFFRDWKKYLTIRIFLALFLAIIQTLVSKAGVW